MDVLTPNFPQLTMAFATDTDKWKLLVADKRRRQQANIPPEWVLKSPPAAHVIDVRAFPDTNECGLLTQREVMITNTTDVDLLLRKLTSAEWSAVEVTTAFYKRAIVAHQLVCASKRFTETLRMLKSDQMTIGQLPHRDFR